MIALEGVSLQRGSKFLLEEVDLSIFPGQKLGIIGANGSGKSSLFKLLLKQLQVDAGRLDIPVQWRLSHMAQEVTDVERSALDYILDGDKALRSLEQAIANAGDDGEKLAHLYGELEHLDGYTAASRAAQLLDGLGFANSDHARPVTDFSGGWRIRLNLAQALMSPSDLLLLDEPTNHLDLDATLWLEGWLQAYSGTLLIISHDRDFLDNVVGRIVSIESGKLVAYSGNYSAYEKQRAERLAQQQAAFVKQQEKVEHLESYIRRFRAKATKAKQAQSRIKQLERMEAIAPAHVDSPFTFTFPAHDKVSDPLLVLNKVDVGYADKKILADVNINIAPGQRVGLLGPNGAGKSSLIKTIAGLLSPMTGDRVTGEHFRLGYFAQHQLEALDLQASAALHIQRISPKASEQQIRNFLGGFDFQGDRAFETINHFSGGEKARLALALIAWQTPNVLLLDEPTNHLDLEMRQALTMALQDYPGAVIVVSHDRHLLRNTIDEWLLVADGKVKEFDGTLEEYHHWLIDYKRKQAPASKGSDKPVNKVKSQATNAQREQKKTLIKSLKKQESQVDKFTAEVAKVEAQLADTSLYEDAQKERLQPLLQAQADAQQNLASAEEAWLQIQEELDLLSDD
ncbi:ATP-binding cassette domain-containing protein [Gilvimarinus agarilyticus]|uniref:ATP-binding cassette domain-containing protein n=1 Tax=unclassified Gilvimarinus TaxID=2642066 RepID=UPI001C08F603|nr:MULTISPECIES: ATP-binding cassette domain-containing protein [unclassified Gilvimarinus]MBU2886334.1 ATP-binding cassette domain-containing protein [Gilvimarinus agarilyticus]MDO6571020.1 ATP-binding cassette domain-containing protein [Gilvimarinus sp. 2_MG-2023]MDO6747980.1 ATP-binding cassette domain-containing protein [Gilvimarinus sp. 1_MG-2023]